MNQDTNKMQRTGFGYLVNKAGLYFKINVLKCFKENNFGVTIEQFAVLYFLSKENGLYQRQLAKLALKDRPNITRLIDILQKKGFVYRKTDPNNRRIFKIFITDEGINQVETIHPYLIEVNKRAVEGISEEEQELFRGILEKICENLDDDFKMQI